MKLHVEHDLDPAELADALLGLAKAEGLDVQLGEDLRKAGPPRWPRETHQREMAQALAARYGPAAQAATGAATAWLGARALRLRLAASEGGGDGAALEKAAVGVVHLTAQEIAELERLIALHWSPTLGEPPVAPPGALPTWGIPRDVWHRWRTQGVVPRAMPIPEIRDAFVAGRLYQVIDQGATYDQMRHLATQAPLSRAARLALDFAEAHAAHHMTGFGARQGARAARAALLANRRLTRDLIADYLRGDLRITRPPAEGPPHDLTLRERRRLSSDRAAATWRDLAAELRRTFLASDADRDWLRLANTEVRLAHNAGRLFAYQEQGVRRLRAIVQPDACAGCKRLYLRPDGTPRIFTLASIVDAFSRTGGLNVGRTASRIGDPERGWIVTGGVIHPWCIPTGTRVEGAVVGGLETAYAGPIREIQTARGHRLTVTPNHPILTLRGWVPAAGLHEGDHVVSHRGRRGATVLPIHPDDQDPPALVEEVFEALASDGFTVRPVAPSDLHGDAIWAQGEIKIVDVLRPLRLHRIAASLEFVRNRLLPPALHRKTSGVGFGALELLPQGNHAPTSRGVGAMEIAETFLATSSAPLEPLRLGAPSEWNVPLLEAQRQDVAANAGFLRQLLHRGAGLIALDEIIQIRDRDFTGHVYDLQTTTGWMIADGIVISNCRCTLIPALDGLTSPRRRP